MKDVVTELVTSEGMYGHPLQATTQSRNEKAVQMLLDAGANLNPIGSYHATLLQAAPRHGQEASVKPLLNSRANINAETISSYGGLHTHIGGPDITINGPVLYSHGLLSIDRRQQVSRLSGMLGCWAP